MTPLETSLKSFADANGFTSVSIGYDNWDCAKNNPFQCEAHFKDAREGEIPCVRGRGATIAEAMAVAVISATAKRVVAVAAALPDISERK